MNLEQITQSLLNGEINNQEAKELCNKIKRRTKQPTEDMNIIFEEDKITAYNTQEQEIGSLKYYEFKDSQYNSVLIIDYVESYIKNQGVFRTMLNSLLKHANHKRKNYLLLEVDVENKNAIEIYRHCGFYETNDKKIIPSQNTQTKWMRYNLN